MCVCECVCIGVLPFCKKNKINIPTTNMQWIIDVKKNDKQGIGGLKIKKM